MLLKKLKLLTTEYGKAATAVNQANSSTLQMTKAATGVKKGLAGMGRSTGQVGIQIQQLVGQIQGGQNAFQAFGAQAADIGIVMGAPLIGVVAAFAAAIAGTLAPALLNGKTELEEFTEAIEKFKTGLSETDKASKDTFSQLEIAKLNSEIYQGEQGIKKMEEALVDLTKQAPSQSVTSQIIGTSSQISKAQDNLDALRKKRDAIFDASLDSKDLKDASVLAEANDKISESLKRQIIELESGSKASLEYATAQALQLKAGEQIPEAIQAQIDKIFELKAAQAAQAEQEKKNAEMAKDIAKFKKEQQDAATAKETSFKKLRARNNTCSNEKHASQ